MSAGTFAWALLWLATGQLSNDVVFTNSRNHRIPVNFQEARRNEIRELTLFVSSDQGKSYNQVAVITPDKEAFTFFAPKDGQYWLRVAIVNRLGRQEPENVNQGAPDLKMVIDTLKPIIRYLNAQRAGDEVVVNWEIAEENIDGAGGLRLDYQVKDSGSPLWTTVQLPNGTVNQSRFRANINMPLTLRLSVKDLAGNQSYALAEIPAANGAVQAAFNQAPGSPPQTQNANAMVPVTLPQGVQIPSSQQQFLPPPTQNAAAPFNPPAPIAPPTAVNPVLTNPLQSAFPSQPPVVAQPTPVTGIPNIGTVPQSPVQQIRNVEPQVVQTNRIVSRPPPAPTEQVVASSEWKEEPQVQVRGKNPLPPPMPNERTTPDTTKEHPGGSGITNAVPKTKPLPPLRYVDKPELVMEYEVSRVGPSGISSIDLWWTQNDGQSWEMYAEAPEIKGTTATGRQQRSVPVPSDGVYGFFLVIKSQAGLGRKPPSAGDAPEIRVEVDTVPPVAQLFKPVPDPQRPNALLLKWKANDKNLTERPISLEWAEKREGPWNPIQLDLANSERFSWQLPDKLPVEIFMRLRVRDKAGNESVALTPRPELVDLQPPEGRLVDVISPQQR